MSDRVVLLQEDTGGHRVAYVAFLTQLLRRHGIDVECRRLGRTDLMSRAPILSTMFEEHPIRFLLMAGFRSLLGRRSAALLFRPVEAVSGRTARLRSKRRLLAAAMRLRGLTILSIVPPYAFPGIERMTSGWIYDLQFWDLPLMNQRPTGKLAASLQSWAGSRPIFVLLGRQDADKGIVALADLLDRHPDLAQRYAIVCAGRIDPALRSIPSRLADAGVQVLDRFVTDDELLDVYAVCDIVWSCYAPWYDQSSGIFGRAVQRNRIAIVRDGSIVERIARHTGARAVPIPWEDPDGAAAILRGDMPGGSGANVGDMRRESLTALGSALGLSLQEEDA